MVIIVPINDIREHEENSSTCPCDPKVEIKNGEMVLIHNAFDHRQIVEQAREILKRD